MCVLWLRKRLPFLITLKESRNEYSKLPFTVCHHFSTSRFTRPYGKILRELIEEENKDEEEQSGFRTGRSCTDNIFCMKQVIEKKECNESRNPFIICGFDKNV